MKWVTRERSKDQSDRLSSAHLALHRSAPVFRYVPSSEALHVARDEGATPYDIPGVELSHVGPLCSFDAFLKKYQLDDPALEEEKLPVRSAPTRQRPSPGEVASTLAFLKPTEN